MRIQITNDGREMNVTLPTRLLFNSVTAKLIFGSGRIAAKSGKIGVSMEHFPEEGLKVLFAEINRIKKKYGSWELVEVISTDGEYVKISL